MADTQLDGPRRPPAAGGDPRALVVLLHGVGSDGNDMIALAPLWGPAVPHALFVAPDAPFPYDQAPPGFPGRQWFSLAPWLARGGQDTSVLVSGARQAAAVVNGFVDAELARLGLSPERCVLMGFSQGAITALAAGLGRPMPPAGIMAYSGALTEPPRARRTAPPVLLVHGMEDDVVPVAASQAAETALRGLGLPVDSLYPPHLRHGIDDAGIAAGAAFLRKVLA